MEDFSQMPEDIIHHILSLLTTKEVVRTSMFCKTWYNAWLTCPTLDFGNISFNPPFNSERGEKFSKFIKSTLQRYQAQKIRIVKLILDLSMIESYSASLVDEWIDISVQNGVELLEVNFDYRLHPYPYVLPRTIFEAKTLRELIVSGSKVEMNKQIGYKAMFNHLRKLHLSHINIDDDMFQDIISRCPLIENLCVHKCDGLKRIKVTNLYYLKEFTVWDHYDQSIEIDAPQLQLLDCQLYCGSLDLYTAEKLKYLSFDGTLPSATFFDNFMHKFAQVENLRLANCDVLETINISSHSLKRIMLENMKDLREVKIDAPSICMLSFNFYYPILFPDLSLNDVSSQWVLKIYISNPRDMDTYQLCKLKEFLVKLIPSKISLGLRFDPMYSRFDDVRQIPICPVVQVEVLDLCCSYKTTLAHENFLDALFLTCHPKAITIDRHDESTGFLYKNLMKIRRNQDGCIVTYHETMSCWYQDLKEVRFEIYDETKHVWQPSDWEKMQEAPQHWDRVRFKLEWGSITS